MKRAHMMALGAGVSALAVISACIIEDAATATCNDFEDYLYDCYPECTTDWACVSYYDNLDWETQDWLDECANCLWINRVSCVDCDSGGYSCFDLLTDYLGLACVW